MSLSLAAHVFPLRLATPHFSPSSSFSPPDPDDAGKKTKALIPSAVVGNDVVYRIYPLRSHRDYLKFYCRVDAAAPMQRTNRCGGVLCYTV
jgi:hypothetical protein